LFKALILKSKFISKLPAPKSKFALSATVIDALAKLVSGINEYEYSIVGGTTIAGSKSVLTIIAPISVIKFSASCELPL
jgi:hypothetical protein